MVRKYKKMKVPIMNKEKLTKVVMVKKVKRKKKEK
jgi:hypothetical protein